MAATMKRVLNEVLVRFDLQGKLQGTHAKYVNYLTADDGVTPTGVMLVDDARVADWGDPELAAYLSSSVQQMQADNAALTAQVAKLQSDNTALAADKATLAAQLATAQTTSEQ